MLLGFASKILCFSQDIIILKNGDEIKSKVLEINTSEIKYKKFDNADGPTFTMAKQDVFMIKYPNGSKDVFNNTVGANTTVNDNKSANDAKVIFYRTKSFAGSGNAFIIGSNKPDTVFVKLKNGTYCEIKIKDFRDWEFIGGTLNISAYQKISIEQGKTYYIHCFLKASFPADKGCFELVDEQTALNAMKDLKVYKK